MDMLLSSTAFIDRNKKFAATNALAYLSEALVTEEKVNFESTGTWTDRKILAAFFPGKRTKISSVFRFPAVNEIKLLAASDALTNLDRFSA